MAEVQDDEQWLYGDDKGEASNSNSTEKDGENVENEAAVNKTEAVSEDAMKGSTVKDATKGENAVQNGEAQKENDDEDDDDDDSSSDDEPTVTIGKLVKQPDIIRPPPPPTHRAAPTSGLKDEDFSSIGKINGVCAVDYNLMELEEKPWRKPGADLSDYFNYGFTEETWFKYCERQKAVRTNESGVGLSGLGINIGKSSNLAFGSSNIPVSIVNENSKYSSGVVKKFNFPPPALPNLNMDAANNDISNSSQGNTIQVMTADRRSYSNKVLNMSHQGYDDMDFGGYGPMDPMYFNTPPPPIFSQPPPIHTPPSWPPPVPPPGFGAPPPAPVPPPVHYLEEEIRSKEARTSSEIEPERHRSREPRERESRHRDRESSSRRRSRSHSRSRHSRKRSKSRSRSRTPSHRHKKKKSKREREEREDSKSR